MMEELKPAEILKAVHTCGTSFCTTDHHECPYGDDGCIDCVDRLEADFEALIAAGDDLVIRRTAPENKPLTLEQFRQMDGEPVWIVEAPDWGHWELSEHAEDYLDDRDPDFYGMKHDDPAGRYGLHVLGWLAYARKPEGSEKT